MKLIAIARIYRQRFTAVRKFIIAIALLAFFSHAYAHQPRLVLHSQSSFDEAYIIEEPEISKAFYGELKGSADYYLINSDRAFSLYINILAPDISGARTDFQVEVLDDRGSVLFSLQDMAQWASFFEPYAGDQYFSGPELNKDLGSGIYYVKVFNSDSSGKYALAVGAVESFPLEEIIKTLIILPRLKRDFFGKSMFSAYWNISGLVLIACLIVAAAAFYVARLLLKKCSS